MFLEKRLDLRDLDKSGQTPLHAAAGRGSGAIDLLIASDADMEAIDLNERTALNVAESGNAEAMKIPIDRGANLKNNRTLSAVIGRFKPGKVKQEIVELLLKKGATIAPGLLYSAVSQGDIKVVKILLSRGADAHEFDEWDNTTLLMRIVQLNTEISPSLNPA